MERIIVVKPNNYSIERTPHPIAAYMRGAGTVSSGKKEKEKMKGELRISPQLFAVQLSSSKVYGLTDRPVYGDTD